MGIDRSALLDGQQRLQGLVAATFTPLDAMGKLDLGRVEPMVDFLVDQKMAGLYVLGSTGEGVLLTEQERRLAAESFVSAAAGRLPVIVQVGCESIAAAAQLAAHAEEVGADAISAISPLYFKPPTVDLLVESMAEIAGAAPQLAFYYYHIPALSGVQFDMLDFLRLGSERVANLRGIKFTSPAIHEYQACLEFADGQFDILWGSDEMLLAGLAVGGRAAVGSTYNYAANIYHRLWQAWEQSDLASARKFQSQAQAVVRTFVRYGARSAQKAIMSMIGWDCGPTRLPIPALPEKQFDALQNELKAIGFFDWIR